MIKEVIGKQVHSSCRCRSHTNQSFPTHTASFLFPLHYVQISSLSRCTHIFHESTISSEWAQSLYSAASCLARMGKEWMRCGRKEIARCSVSPPASVLIGGREPLAGNGGPSRLFGLPGDGHYRRHSMAVCAAISTPQGSSLCAEGQLSKSVCMCRTAVCAGEGKAKIDDRVAFLIRSS